jgi:hypothetical protein
MGEMKEYWVNVYDGMSSGGGIRFVDREVAIDNSKHIKIKCLYRLHIKIKEPKTYREAVRQVYNTPDKNWINY